MTCTHCNDTATMRCRNHRQYLCFDPYCRNLHRMGGGDCDLFPVSDKSLRGWKQHLLATAVALGVGLLVVSVLVI